MKNNLHLISFILLMNCFLLFSCDSLNSEEASELIIPSDLVINSINVGATTQSPNGDGSGVVNFSISSTNASSYKVDFGNGEIKEITNGDFSYTYTNQGSNVYAVQVTAYIDSKYITLTKYITVDVNPAIVWSDEFDKDGPPNDSKWLVSIGAGGWGNNESQYYTDRPENIIVQGGILKIKTLKENYNGSNYTSARIQTYKKYSLKYGKIEFRAKMPIGGGIWPSLWLLGNNIEQVSWPACGEIDVAEHLGNELNKIYTAVHYPDHFGGNGNIANVGIENATTDFHIYSVDWRADAIKFYVDNKLVHSFENSASTPFNLDFFITINCAIGGYFGGAIDPNFTSSTFEIDYVRVYK